METVVQYAGMATKVLPESDDDLILIDIKTRAQLARRARIQGELNPVMEQSLRDNRVLAPLSLLAVLALLFIFSPFLPSGIREYISALIR